MSSSSSRRITDRGGAGGRIASTKLSSTKTLTPLSVTKPVSSAAASSKENSNQRGTVHQKPWIRPMQRIEKPIGAVDGTERKRWSMTSSVPRGRSSSPADFGGRLSDLGKSKGSRVSRVSGVEEGEGERGRNGVKVIGKKRGTESSVNGVGLFAENGDLGSKLGKFDGKDSGLKGNAGDETKIKARFVDDSADKEHNLSLNRNSRGRGNNGACVAGEKVGFDRAVAGVGSVGLSKKCDGDIGVNDEEKRNGGELDTKKSSGENVSNGKGVTVSMEKTTGGGRSKGESSGGNVASRLHEKLALLDEKVRKIASDIKKAKETLDMDNSSSSKEMISDIQQKILGIEKAMACVKVDSARKAGRSMNKKGNVTTQQGNCDPELEPMLLPHQKLLRGGASVKETSLVSGNSRPEVLMRNISSGSSDVNPIALDFLASLGKEQHIKEVQTGFKGNEVQETEESTVYVAGQAPNMMLGNTVADIDLRTDEKLEEIDDCTNKPEMIIEEEILDNSIYQLSELGCKASTGGWFLGEGESVLLAHVDGSCSVFDIVNHEEKAVYKAPSEISPNVWRDCWVVRAAGADGCAGRYVVAASAGNTVQSAFCSWDYYTRKVQALHVEQGNKNARSPLRPLSENVFHRRSTMPGLACPQAQYHQAWYRPCGPLMVSTASGQMTVKVFDVRDGEQIMMWKVSKPVVAMDYCSPLQWRNRAKVVIAEADAVSLWDVSSRSQQGLSSVPIAGGKVSALHINHTDAEVGAGFRQRVSSSEAEGHDGVFCLPDSTNVIDFRQPSGLALSIPFLGVNVQSVFSRGDSIYVGCTTKSSAAKKQVSSQIHQFSLRKQKLVHTYRIPESNAHSHQIELSQVWGNSSHVMGICGQGLYVFDALNDEAVPSLAMDEVRKQKVREVIGPDNMYAPSFDYVSSQALLISRDRPAMRRLLRYDVRSCLGMISGRA